MNHYKEDSALREAKAQVSLPALIHELCPQADLQGLKANGTNGSPMTDPRPGQDEATGSFTVNKGRDGTWMYYRHDGATPGGDAITLLMDLQGLSFPEARAELIRRAGLSESPATPPRRRPTVANGPLKAVMAKQLRAAVPPDLTQRTQDWAVLEAEGDGPQRTELERRGLWTAVTTGLLRAYRLNVDAKPPFGAVPDALLLEIRGPAGDPVAYKIRNPGAKEAFKPGGKWAKFDRYRYLGKGSGTPAMCPVALDAPSVRAEIWLEGELNAVAVAAALHAVSQHGFAVQGMAGQNGKPHVTHDLQGRRVYVTGDHDEVGLQAQQQWAALALAAGAEVYTFALGDAEHDACDLLGQQGAEALGQSLLALIDGATPYIAPSPSTPPHPKPSDSARYADRDGALYRLDLGRDGHEQATQLANFSAWITHEFHRHAGTGQPNQLTSDGGDIRFRIAGRLADGTSLPPFTVRANDLPRVDWTAQWGYQAVVTPGPYGREHVRAAVLLLSKGVQIIRVYTHTGWVNVDGQWVYLTAGACIGKDGAVGGVECDLSGSEGLELFKLPAPSDAEGEREALRASLALLEAGQLDLVVVLLGAAYRSVLGRSRYVLLVNGTSGHGKTSFVSAIAAHFGAGINEGALPATWQSTGYGLIALANQARDILLPADDLKPEGNDAQKLYEEFRKLVSAAAEAAGRLRLLPDGSSASRGGYPRGTVVVTAESAPPGYSNNARLIQVTLRASLLQTPEQKARMKRWTDQAAQGVYARAMAGFVRWVAQNHAELYGEERRRQARETLRQHFVGQHVRSPDNIADLAAGWQTLLEYARHCQALTDREAADLWAVVLVQLRQVAVNQVAHLEAVDPVVAALRSLDTALRTQAAYLVDAETGEAPERAEQWGWRAHGDGTEYSIPHGARRIGYVSRKGEQTQLWLEPEATYVLLNERAVKAGGSLPSQGDFWRRVRERLTPLDLMIHEHGKNTHRRTVYGSKSRVALINLLAEFTQILDPDVGTGALPGAGEAVSPDDERVEVARL